MEKIEILKEEYNYICGALNDFINEQFQILNYSLIIISGVFLYGFSKDQITEILPYIPIGFLTLMNYLLYRLQRNNMQQAYRRRIEYRINELLNEEREGDSQMNYLYYSKIGKDYLMERNFFQIMQLLLYVSFYIGAVVCGYFYNPIRWLFFLEVFLLFVYVVAVCILFSEKYNFLKYEITKRNVELVENYSVASLAERGNL